MSIALDTPVQFLKGVGPKISELLAKKDVRIVRDILTWYPRAYESRRAARQISSLQEGETVSFLASIVTCRKVQMGRTRRSMQEMIFSDDTGRINGKWFRQPYPGYFDKFKPGSKVRVTGLVKNYRFVKEMHHPEVQILETEETGVEDIGDGLIPIYSETEGLNQRLIRKVVSQALEQVAGKIDETFPGWILEKYKLPQLTDCFTKLHDPGPEDLNLWQDFKSPYQRRIIFEEFFWLELVMARSRMGLVNEKAHAMRAVNTLGKSIRSQLPFKLTDAQEKVLSEITEDLLKPHPMHRLVQGDVGCGKTMVAFLSAALVIENGFQVAMMAPTEILAEQHFLKAKSLFESLGIRVGILTGGKKDSEAEKIREQVKDGTIQFLIGTHALIQKDTKFKRLGLAIIDEQHRFGVRQRQELVEKSVSPHFLIMTATPIPRTLAMTVYGDLDVSVINEMPKGRQPITTRLVFENKRRAVYDFVKEQLGKGRQAYVIYPLVEETEKLDLKNATDMAKVLAEELAPFKVGLLHGRMKSQEKDELMRDFKDNKLQVLVSTTVIEVGVDVPNASVMVIEHAERFGLAQLHQLRGRVGRGEFKSYCVLMSSYALGEESRARLEVMTQTNDGFKIAEKDLEIRGPGEFMGTRQSGLPGFRMANLVRDVEVLAEARKAAFDLVRLDPELKQQDNKNVRRHLETGIPLA